MYRDMKKIFLSIIAVLVIAAEVQAIANGQADPQFSKTYMVVVSYFSPGFRTVLGNSG